MKCSGLPSRNFRSGSPSSKCSIQRCVQQKTQALLKISLHRTSMAKSTSRDWGFVAAKTLRFVGYHLRPANRNSFVKRLVSHRLVLEHRCNGWLEAQYFERAPLSCRGALRRAMSWTLGLRARSIHAASFQACRCL